MGDVVLMQGNEACVEGALAAGMRLFAGYPITPSTEIAELSSIRLPEEGGKAGLFSDGEIFLETGPVHTVKPLSVRIPKGRLTVVTGVSGSGKTTMVLECLMPGLEALLAGRPLPECVRELKAEGIRHAKLIDAAPIGYNSTEYEKFLHHDGFKAILYLNITKKLFAAVHERAEKEPMSETQKAAYAQCWKDQSDLQSVFGLADDWMQAHYDGNASEEDTLQLEAYLESMHKLEAKLRASANALNDAFGKPIKARWDYNTEYWSDKGSEINEVYVDFR